MNLSIVVPCYRSEFSIEELVERIYATLGGEMLNTEIILVNDCSPDNTVVKMRELAVKYPRVMAVDLMFNVGQFRALMCGLELSNGRFVVTMDDDLQHPPEEIPKMIAALEADEDCDVILGYPIKKEHKIYRNIGSWLIRWVNKNIFQKPKNLRMSAFRILRREAVDTITAHKTMFPIMGPIILKSTKRIKNIDVEHHSRKYGKSNYNLLKLISTTFDNIINFSSLPLKLISWVGFMAFSFSVVSSMYYFVRFLIGGIGVPGWTTNVLLLNFYGGLILFSIGVIGEYLIRILFEVNRFPRYTIRKVYKKDEI